MGSIPLAANNLKVPEQPNALEQYARIMQIKSAQQGQQMQGIQIQQAQKQQKDDEVVRQAFGANKGDIDKTLNDVAGKVSPQTYTALQQHAVDVKTKTADLVAKQGANAALQADLMVGAHDAVDKAPADQKPAVYQQQVQALQQRGVDTSQMPQQYPGDEPFKLIGAVVQGHKQQVEDALKQTEGAKNTAQATEAGARTGEVQANTAKIQAEMNFYKKQGLAPGVPLDAQEAADWMNKNPGKGPADFMKMKAALVPQMNFNLQNGGSGPGTPAYQDSVNGVATGKLKIENVLTPRTPYSVRQQFLSDVMNANPSFKASDFDIEKGVAKSFTSGKVSDELNAYNTAIAHADLLKAAADAMNNGNIRALNSLGNQLGVQFGSDKKTNFDIIRNAYTAEVTKALTSGHITDTELGKQGGTMPDNASPSQFAGAVDSYKALMASKKQQRVDQFNQGTQAKPNFGNQSQSGSYTPPAGAKSAIGPNGHKIVVDGGKWVDAETGKPIQ